MNMPAEPVFPAIRPRRLRYHPLVRDLVRENLLTISNLIYPLFVRSGQGIKKEIASMPGNYQLSVDRLVEEVGSAARPGGARLHPVRHPHAQGRHRLQRLDAEGIVQQALRACANSSATASC